MVLAYRYFLPISLIGRTNYGDDSHEINQCQVCTFRGDKTLCGLGCRNRASLRWLCADFTAGQKAKVKGAIISRKGDLVKVQDAKTGSIVVVKITDDTKIVRDKSKVSFHRHEDMDVTAMLPGLTIGAEGVGNAASQLEASKITFSPDVFAVEVAQQQEISANKAAANNALATANQGVTAAAGAQSSANQAQTTADQAGAMAQAAGVVALTNAAAVQIVNQRVSDLDDYQTVAEAAIFYPSGQATLDAAAKADLDKLAALAAVNRGLHD